MIFKRHFIYSNNLFNSAKSVMFNSLTVEHKQITFYIANIIHIKILTLRVIVKIQYTSQNIE